MLCCKSNGTENSGDIEIECMEIISSRSWYTIYNHHGKFIYSTPVSRCWKQIKIDGKPSERLIPHKHQQQLFCLHWNNSCDKINCAQYTLRRIQLPMKVFLAISNTITYYFLTHALAFNSESKPKTFVPQFRLITNWNPYCVSVVYNVHIRSLDFTINSKVNAQPRRCGGRNVLLRFTDGIKIFKMEVLWSIAWIP